MMISWAAVVNYHFMTADRQNSEEILDISDEILTWKTNKFNIYKLGELCFACLLICFNVSFLSVLDSRIVCLI